MRRLHLRGRANVAKRVLVHAAAFNVGLLMRVRYGLRKPRSCSRAAAAARAATFALADRVRAVYAVVTAVRPLRSLDEMLSRALATRWAA